MKGRLFVLLLLFLPFRLFAAGEHCSSAYLEDWYVPALGTYHKVAKVVDPAGQQVARFDLTWGGILVSMTYGGAEYIAGPSTTAGSQAILRTTNYTPTMGGDSQNRGSVVTGAACSPNHLWLTSGMTDYNQNASASTAYVYTNNQWFFNHLIAPYVVSTHSYFVPNPAGSPQYYLKVDRTINNIDGTDIDAPENFSFTLDISTAVPTTFSYYAAQPYCDAFSPCANTTPSLTSGFYNSSGLTSGIAMATFPAMQWSGQPGNTTITTEVFANRRVMHFNKTSHAISPHSSKTYSTYVMLGSWANAANYAARACSFAVQKPAARIARSGATFTLSVSTNASCPWEARSDKTWATVSPSSGSGNGSVTVTVQANNTGAIRMANLNIAGKVLTFFQYKD